MEEMDGYWWQCVCGFKSKSPPGDQGNVPTYIRYRIMTAQWDQDLLERRCPICGQKKMRITYLFPRKAQLTLQLLHVIGLNQEDEYVPMLWEAINTETSESMFEFNYIVGANPWGLNKAAVLSLDDIRTLIELYREKTGKPVPFTFSQ